MCENTAYMLYTHIYCNSSCHFILLLLLKSILRVFLIPNPQSGFLYDGYIECYTTYSGGDFLQNLEHSGTGTFHAEITPN